MFSIPAFILGVFLLFGSALAACTTPGLDVCHDGSNTTCSTLSNGRWTYTNGSLIGTPADTSALANATYMPCYCQLSYADSSPADNNTVVTKCFQEQYLFYGYGTTPEPKGYANWYDGVEMMTSGYDNGESSYYMNCQSDFNYSPDMAPQDQALTYITWVQPIPDIQAALPPNAIFDSNGLCPGFDVQAGFQPNVENPDNVTITSSDAVNCTCSPFEELSLDDDGDSSQNNFPTFSTICSSSFEVYWNGQGYRSARHEQGSNDVTDSCNYPGQSGTSVAYVMANTSSGGGGGGGNSNSSTRLFDESLLLYAAFCSLFLFFAQNLFL